VKTTDCQRDGGAVGEGESAGFGRLARILADESWRQREFPIARRKVYLAHAGVCPLPFRVQEAIRRYADEASSGDQEAVVSERFLQETREVAAAFLGSTPEEIAWVGPTSSALSVVAGGLLWKAGESVVVYYDDYPTAVYPWMAMAERGVEVRRVMPRQWGQIEVEDVLARVDASTRLVALASCHYVSGWRLDHVALGRALRARGVGFCLDAIQTLGAFPIEAGSVDYLAADAHKWLLGPCGAGILHVRRECQEALRPSAWGWHSIECPNFITQPELVWRRDARRYEPGTANLLGLVGLRAALDLLGEIGMEAIGAELLRKRAWLVPELEARGYRVANAAAAPGRASAILSLDRPGTDMARVYERLARSGVVTSLRADRAGKPYVRLSPHFYNTDAELRHMLAHLD